MTEPQMISLADYYMDRREKYALDLTPDLERNALRTVDLVNRLLVIANTAGVRASISPTTGTVVSSGWRPPAVNEATANSAKGTSKHLQCNACDIRTADGKLARWAASVAGTVLKDLGLWMEDPGYTPTWLHVQTIKPPSGNRIFIPFARRGP